MTIRRAALYIGGATLLVAWLSSASSLSPQSATDATPAPQTETDLPAERLIADVQAQSGRLKQRLATAPLPQKPARNPFMFAAAPTAERAGPARRLEAAALPPPPMGPAEPALSLIGIAEDHRPEGVRRTAMIATEGDELVVAAIGDPVAGRYKVTAIGQDAVELADSATGLIRRLGLHYR
jgi:hypothetical protein